MTALLRAELIKLRTTRTFIALVAVAITISTLITILVALSTEPDAGSVLDEVFQSDVSSVFIMLLAVIGVSGEWRHRTITSSLLAAPDRVRFLGAKTIAFALAGIALSVAISLLIAIFGLAILSGRDLPTPEIGELIARLARTIAVAGLLGAFGVAVGALVRNQAVAVVGIVLLAFLIEPLITSLAPDVGRFGPTGALPIAIIGGDPETAGFSDLDLLAPGLAVVAMAAWIGVLFAASAVLLKTRDLD